jgi:type III restriction enzyme
MSEAAISLMDFQSEAADRICEVTIDYMRDPAVMGRASKQRRIPFFQLLNSITASGKTLILADAVSSIAQMAMPKPVVLWLSKASVVVAQTYENLDAGGSYQSLLDDFEVRPLADYREEDLSTSNGSCLYFATVGTFNQRQRAEGSLNIFKSSIDAAATSTWESLKRRPDPTAARRPLIVIYDEAQNLSDQQTELLLELEPDAFLFATATVRFPAKFNTDVILPLKENGELTEADLVTVVDASRVATSGLIKNELVLVGRRAPMESVLDEMYKAFKQATKDAESEGLPGRPKAVYVCKTNVSELTGEKDSPKQPFLQRQAPPILIWRYLAETLKIKPSEIAVYCDLKVDKAHPLPSEFVLFNGGDSDYTQFTKGAYRHIIFNKALQEGWDEPYVYFAYIDMTVGSEIRAEQIAGRLLRQPGRKHYAAQRLNTAQIFVRVDAKSVFEKVVKEVGAKIQSGTTDIKIRVTKPGGEPPEELSPKKLATVPIASVVSDRAMGPITKQVDEMIDFSGSPGGSNTKGVGLQARIQRVVGEPGSEEFEWEAYGESATALARWIFQRELRSYHRDVGGLVLTSNADGTPTKFDARIGFGSKAELHISEVAARIGEIYTKEVYLKLRASNPYVVGSVLIDADEAVSFKNALHKKYDSLNSLEMLFAKAVDGLGDTWCRNPTGSGYKIPLIQPGKTSNFFPDFLVWHGSDVYAIDTKGSHLHTDAARKLQDIKPASGVATRVFVRFISDGKVTAAGPQPDSTGYTAWSFHADGSPKYVHCDDMVSAIRACLIPDV